MNIKKKDNINYKFQTSELKPLLDLAARATPDVISDFKKEFGRILNTLHMTITTYELEAIHTLLQFYDPPLRCFTFSDYQLAPTLEEYSSILGLPILNQVPFHALMKKCSVQGIAAAIHLEEFIVKYNLKPKGGHMGFHLQFLIHQAHTFSNAGDWIAYNKILALCIYEIILFPNIVEFVDMNVIIIFLLGNPIPTLLGDLYHSIHTRNAKKGEIMLCCVPLFYKWFLSHLPKTRAFFNTKGIFRWSEILTGLAAKDVIWYNMSYDGIVAAGKTTKRFTRFKKVTELPPTFNYSRGKRKISIKP